MKYTKKKHLYIEPRVLAGKTSRNESVKYLFCLFPSIREFPIWNTQ